MTKLVTMLDTNVVSDLMRGDGDPAVARFVGEIDAPYLSVIVLHEIAYGLELLPHGAKRARLSANIEAIRAQFSGQLVIVDEAIARLSGELRAQVEKRGGELEPNDALIAATALRRSARLATRNTKHFQGLGLDLVNPWTL
jgi:predicted nucleic acid-binding protein